MFKISSTTRLKYREFRFPNRFVGRSLESRQIERFGILKVIEGGLERYAEVENSHGCLLRTICEIAHTPISGDGLLVSKTLCLVNT